jgi:hypothetical protein
MADAPRNKAIDAKKIVYLPSDNLPDYWNWTEHGSISKVKEMGQCLNSGYAHSAMGALEHL